MSVSLLTPEAAVVGLAGLVAVGMLLSSERRGRRLARTLGLRPEGARAGLGVALALVLLTALLALAAAQPVIAREAPLRGRVDAEAIVVVDISRSMEARGAPDAPRRFERAQEAAIELRGKLGGVPVGIASLTDRLLPHLFPSLSRNSFVATVERAVAVNQPPPESSFGISGRATVFAELADLATQNYYGERARNRVAVVVTDGETAPVSAAELAGPLLDGRIRLVFLHVWQPNERVYTQTGTIDRAYFPDPGARTALDALGAGLQAPVLAEGQVDEAAAAVKGVLGEATTVRRGSELSSFALSPLVAASALLPLGFVLWRRNR